MMAKRSKLVFELLLHIVICSSRLPSKASKQSSREPKLPELPQ